MKIGKIVCIEWEDACSGSGYLDKEHIERHKPALCHTVGHWGKSTRDYVVITGEKFEDGDERYTHTIPRKMIKRIIKLRE